MNKISIIIPILNEADIIENLLKHLLQNSSEELISEIIIVDGGSTDGSQNKISKFSNVILLNSEKFFLYSSKKFEYTRSLVS